MQVKGQDHASAALTPVTAAGTQWASTRVGLDIWKRKLVGPCRVSNPGSPSPRLITMLNNRGPYK